jgi:hypothetical protein
VTATATTTDTTTAAGATADEKGEKEETGSVMLTLTAPADDGGSPITAYLLKAKPGNWQVEAEAMAGEERVGVVFPGLPRGRHYKFTAQARNALGISQASLAVDFRLE